MTEPDALAGFLGADGVLVHIGLPKTGTTALQSCAAARRAELARHGVLYPHVGRTPTDVPNHVTAAHAALDWPVPERIARRARTQWAHITSEVAAHPAKAFVSAENLALADEDHARRIVDELGSERVRVAMTLRPLDQLLASFWQNMVRHGLPMGFDEWARAVGRRDLGAHRSVESFWYVYDIARIVELWAAVVGPERLAVVVVDTTHPDGVFRSGEQLLGVPHGVLDPSAAGRSNRSMSRSEAEMLRRVNAAVAERTGAEVVDTSVLGERVVWNLLEHRRPAPAEERLIPVADAVEALVPVGEETVQRIAAAGVHVLGDLRQLVPDPALSAGDRGPEPDTVPVDAVVLLMEGLLRKDQATAERAAGER